MIAEYTLPTAVEHIPGDTFSVSGGLLIHRRGLAIVNVWQLSQLQRSELSTVKVIGNRITSLLLEVGMPGQNVSMTQVRENQSTGSITVSFSSGTNIELPSWESVGGIADEIDSTPDLAEKILLGKAFRASPDGTNKTTQVGASVSCNLLASEPIVYTPSE